MLLIKITNNCDVKKIGPILEDLWFIHWGDHIHGNLRKTDAHGRWGPATSRMCRTSLVKSHDFGLNHKVVPSSSVWFYSKPTGSLSAYLSTQNIPKHPKNPKTPQNQKVSLVLWLPSYPTFGHHHDPKNHFVLRFPALQRLMKKVVSEAGFVG